MKTSESVKNVSMSFVKASSFIKNMIPDSQGYGYSYTSLGPIIDQIKPILAENKLCVIQSPTQKDDHLGIETIVLHESGEFLSFQYNIPIANVKGANDAQKAGASITYGRRYAISAVFGIATDTDTDATAGKSDYSQTPTVPTPPKETPSDPFKETSLKDKMKEESRREGIIAKLKEYGENKILPQSVRDKYKEDLKAVWQDTQKITEIMTEMEVDIETRRNNKC